VSNVKYRLCQKGVGVKEGWEVKKLGDVCTLINGRAYKKQELLDEGKYRVLRVGNLFTNNKWYYSNMELDEKKYCDNNDLIYAWSASFGPRIWQGEKVIYHYHIWKVEPNLEFITKLYLFRLFEWDKEQIKSDHGTGTTMMHVGKASMESRLVPIPPLPEQTQIVKTLDLAFKQIDQAKANLEKNLANAKELFASKLNEVFSQRGEGWEECEINEICESIIDCVNKTAPSVIEETPFKMIRTTNIRFGKVNLEKVKYVTDETYAIWTRRQKPKRGDLLFTREAPMGEIGMLLSDDDVFLGQRIVSYRIDEKKANNFFILYAFQSLQIQEQVKKLGSGATVQHLRVPHTKDFKLFIPSLKKQNEIVCILTNLKEKTENLQTHYQQKLNNLEELKKSILQKAFRGEL
jgi:type I restriction enzyme S subunit